jgi:hypothetical protein
MNLFSLSVDFKDFCPHWILSVTKNFQLQKHLWILQQFFTIGHLNQRKICMCCISQSLFLGYTEARSLDITNFSKICTYIGN